MWYGPIPGVQKKKSALLVWLLFPPSWLCWTPEHCVGPKINCLNAALSVTLAILAFSGSCASQTAPIELLLLPMACVSMPPGVPVSPCVPVGVVLT